MSYKTIKSTVSANFFEKKSEFIGSICPCKTNDEAVAFINEVKARHKKANHNVYAYILQEDNISRYSDDGEPQGTGGVPVLDVLKKANLVDVCVVATRYFGGVMLGKGGLVRAYSHSATIAIDASQIMNMQDCYEISFKTDYNLYGKITYFLPEFEVKMLQTDFSDEIFIKFLVKAELCKNLEEKLIDISNGQIILSKSEKICADF